MDEQTSTPTPVKSNPMMWIVGLIIVVAVILIIALFVRGQSQKQQQVSPVITPQEVATESAEATEGAGFGDSSIAASDQSAGNTVTIDTATFTKPGYIVVHEQKGLEADKPIGQSVLYLPGTVADVSVKLNRPSKAGETLYVMLHDDDGDGTYEFPGPDAPTQNRAGQVVIAKFVIK